MEPSKDQRLWRMAKKRAGFKRSLFTFIVITAFLWAIWWITGGRHDFNLHRSSIPWPVWPMLGLTVALAFQYFSAYNGNRSDMVEDEYEKLRKEQNL
jgi:hypothetical protein